MTLEEAERRVAIEKAVGRGLLILVIIGWLLFLVKSTYMAPPISIPGLDFVSWLRRLINPILQNHPILFFVWGTIPASFDYQRPTFWLLLGGFLLIAGLMLDRAYRLGSLTRRARETIQVGQWARPYLSPHGSTETTINIGARITLPESRWERAIRIAEGILIEIIAGVILLLIGLLSFFRR